MLIISLLLILSQAFSVPGVYFDDVGLGFCVSDDGKYGGFYWNSVNDGVNDVWTPVDIGSCEAICADYVGCIGYNHLPGGTPTCILWVAGGTEINPLPSGFGPGTLPGEEIAITTGNGQAIGQPATHCFKMMEVQCVFPGSQDGYSLPGDATLTECTAVSNGCVNPELTGVTCANFWLPSTIGITLNPCDEDNVVSTLTGCVESVWETTNWSDCSANCEMGTGYKFRTVTCSTSNDVDCDPSTKPDEVEACSWPTGICSYSHENDNSVCCGGNIATAHRFCEYANAYGACHDMCNADPLCEGYSRNPTTLACALATQSDCVNDISIEFYPNNLIHVWPMGSCHSEQYEGCYKKQQYNGWDFGSSSSLQYNMEYFMVVLDVTPIPTFGEGLNQAQQGMWGIISAITGDEFFGTSDWDQGVFEVKVNGDDEAILIKASKQFELNGISMFRKYPNFELNDWSTNDVIFEPVRQCRFQYNLQTGYVHEASPYASHLFDCSVLQDGCIAPLFNGIACDTENGYSTVDGISVNQCVDNDFATLSGCSPQECGLPNSQVGYDIAADASISTCTAVECSGPTLTGVTCAQNYAAFTLSAMGCTAENSQSELTGCLEVIQQSFTGPFNEAMAQMLCQNMASEANGLIFSCALTPVSGRRFLEGLSTVTVQIGVPHVTQAIEQVSEEGFLHSVLPDGVEAHEVEFEPVTQVKFTDSNTVAPSQTVSSQPTVESTTAIPSSTPTAIPTVAEEILTVVSESDDTMSMVVIILSVALAIAFAMIVYMVKSNQRYYLKDKRTPFSPRKLDSEEGKRTINQHNITIE